MPLHIADEDRTSRREEGSSSAVRGGTPLLGQLAQPETLLLRVEGRRDVLIDRPVFSIGKAPTCDLVLDDQYVSSMHCEIVLGGRGVFIRDLGSKNGTRVGGRLCSMAELAPGMLISLGRVPIRVLALDAKTIDDGTGIIGASEKMAALRNRLALVGATETRVLLLGENGTGKEIAARALHRRSRRRDRPLIVANCATLTRDLIESALFGHVRGAFTGATSSAEGYFAEADGGTLFLDEIGDLPIDLQPKLLRALEQGTFRPVGAREDRHVDVRVISATNRDLMAMIRAGTYREDLYYRLAQFEVRTPSLRECSEDVPLLAAHFLDGVADAHGYKGIHPEAELILTSYAWPGNVRELRNVILSAVLEAGDVIEARHLPEGLQKLSSMDRSGRRDAIDRAFVAAKLAEAGGNQTRAAQLAGMKKATFCRWVHRHGLVTGR